MTKQMKSAKPTLQILEDRLPLATFVVTNVADFGPGTLRQALVDADANPGFDKVEFNLEGNGPFFFDITRPIHADYANFRGNDNLFIDGYSQSGSKPNDMKIGNNSIIKIEIGGDLGLFNNSIIKGVGFSGEGLNSLASYSRVTLESSNVFQGNFVGLRSNGILSYRPSFLMIGSNNQIGGGSPEDQNVIFYANIGGDNNEIKGNLIGLKADGMNPLIENVHSQLRGGIYLAGNYNLIGGINSGEGNVISGGFNGIGVLGSFNTIQGNFIGTTAKGEYGKGVGNSYAGIEFSGGSGNLVGGTVAGARNVISGNAWAGVAMTSSGTSGQVIQGNYIGTDASGKLPLGNGGAGVWIYSPSKNNVIGGPEEGSGNLIAYNGGGGVVVFGGDSTGNLIDPNKIVNNKRLGIDLGNNGRNVNGRPGRKGPNNLQNYPVIKNAVYQKIKGVAYIVITGSLHSSANMVHRLEFFSNVSRSAALAQGEHFLGFANLKTGNNGFVNFRLRFKFLPGRFITSTATDALRNTSEFSPALVRT